MALKPLRPCRHPGCSALTREGYGPKHKPPKAPRRASAEYHGWYSLPIWTDDLRPAQLLREPFCRECAARYPPGDPRHWTWASVVDHITPHRGDWAKFIDPTNLQSLCKTCHDRSPPDPDGGNFLTREGAYGLQPSPAKLFRGGGGFGKPQAFPCARPRPCPRMPTGADVASRSD